MSLSFIKAEMSAFTEIDRQTDGRTDREADRQTFIQTDRHIFIESYIIHWLPEELTPLDRPTGR